MNWRRSFSKEHTGVPGVHTAEEASRELVKGQCQRQRLYAAAGCDATSMRHFDMSSSMRAKFFPWRMFLFVARIYVHFTGRSACGNCFYVELGCSLRFGGSFCLSLLCTVVYVTNCTDRTTYLKCLSVSFQISLVVSLSESFCWSVYISVCTCVSLLLCVKSRRDVVWALPRQVAVHRDARCRALVQTNGHSMPWTTLTNGGKLPSCGCATTVVGAFAYTGTERGNAMAARATRTREVAEGMCWRFVRS